jgi:AcrR family transcriptional regulator
MARQVRSESTRRQILDAAIDVFGEVGYAAAKWKRITERTGMTKGALYHHFDSKESLASAIIEEGSNVVLVAFRTACGSSSPGLENMIHGTFTIAKVLGSDKMAGAAEQLTAALSGFNKSAARFCTQLVELITAQAQLASAEGDLRQDLVPATVGEAIVGAILGMRLVGDAIPAEGLDGGSIGRTCQVWELLLAGIVSDASLPYFRQFLAREAMHYGQPDESLRGDTVMKREVT